MKKRRISYIRILLIAVLVVALIFGIDAIRRSVEKKDTGKALKIVSIGTPSNNNGSDNSSLDSSVVSENEEAIDHDKYQLLEMTSESLSVGELALVNSEHPYTFPDISENIGTIYKLSGEKDTYKLSTVALEIHSGAVKNLNVMLDDFAAASGKKDITITSALRTKEQQRTLFNADTPGSSDAADVGCCEHHTGYAVDFTIVTAERKIVTFDGTGAYNWIPQNAHKYGFIMRYPESKTNATGIDYEPWHYRFVGIVHASVMQENNYCLEDYLDYVKQFTFRGKHLKKTVDVYSYEIYYVPITEGKASVPVPKDKYYTLSGNNIDGFIVTVYNQAANTESAPDVTTTTASSQTTQIS